MSEQQAVNLDDDFGVELNENEAWGGQSLIAKGKYTAQITFAAKEASKSSGQPVAKITFTIASDGSEYGKKVTKSYSLQPQAKGRFTSLVLACRAPLSGTKVGDLMDRYINLEIIHKAMPARNDDQGNAMPSSIGMEVVNETAIEEEATDGQGEQQAAAPAATTATPAATPAATQAPAAAATQAPAATGGNKNGGGARRAPVARA